MAAEGGHRPRALVIAGKGARNREASAPPIVLAFAGHRSFGRCLCAFLGGRFVFFLGDDATSARRRRRRRALRLLFFFFLFLEAAIGLLFGMLFRLLLGGLSRILFRFALFGSDALTLQAIFLDGAMARFLVGAASGFVLGDTRVRQCAAARDLFLIRELAQNHAAAVTGIARGWRRCGLRRCAPLRRARCGRLLGDSGLRTRAERALLLHHDGFGPAVAETLLDRRRLGFLKRERLVRSCARSFVRISHSSLS